MVVTAAIGNTTNEANTYIVGMQIVLRVPIGYKMFQANSLVGTIININGLQFTLNVDSTKFDVFSIPVFNVASLNQTPASLAPFGSRNLEYNNNTSGVPFQSLNNIGN